MSNKGKKEFSLSASHKNAFNPKIAFAFQISNSFQKPETNTQWAWGKFWVTGRESVNQHSFRRTI